MPKLNFSGNLTNTITMNILKHCIMGKALAGITGSFSMLFLMVFGRFPEQFSFGVFFLLSLITGLILFAYNLI